MKKLAIFIMVLVSCQAFGQFRGYAWGTPRETILDENKWLEADDFSASGKDPASVYVASFYFMDDGRLASGAQVPMFKGSLTADDWLNKYAQYQEILESKYGAAKEKREDWSSSTMKSIMDRATGLLYRDLQLVTTWTTGDTSILLSLENTGDITGDDIYLIILYRSLELDREYREEMKARAGWNL